MSASTASATMRAIHQQQLGGPEVLELVEVPRPSPGPTEVLVRVAGAGVNPVDWKTRRGGAMLGDPPFTVGWDVAGVVEATGGGVTRFSPGDRVFGMPRFPREAGGYSEYVAAPSRQFAATPEALSDIEAAAIPLAGLTAWQALIDTARLESNQRVLIHAAAGGVGHLAVQIAKSVGAEVIGTARSVHHDWLAQLGADQVIDYTTEDVAAAAAEVDLVLDLVGDDVGSRSLPALRDGGTLITIPSSSDVEALREAAAGRVRVTNMLVEPDRVGIEALADLVGDGRLRVRVARTFPLSEAASAHEVGERGEIGGGKLVLRPEG